MGREDGPDAMQRDPFPAHAAEGPQQAPKLLSDVLATPQKSNSSDLPVGAQVGPQGW
jgi:major membrane immunogen (membrane-anchored lipoprotein)